MADYTHNPPGPDWTPDPAQQTDLNTLLATSTPNQWAHLPGTCKHCNNAPLYVINRLETAKPGTFSLAGVQTKFSARTWPYALCTACKATSRAKPATDN